MFYKLKDGSYFEINYNNYHITENSKENIELSNELKTDYELENILEFHSDYKIESKLTNLNDLPQYHFVRKSMCDLFYSIFPLDEFNEYDLFPMDTSSFHTFRDEEEFYILHKPSGTMINWYKHLGRTNTCNKNLSLEELKLFLLLFKYEVMEK